MPTGQCKYQCYPQLGHKDKWCNCHQEDCIGYEDCGDYEEVKNEFIRAQSKVCL